MRKTILILTMLAFTGLSQMHVNAQGNSNINFIHGNFTNWQCYSGTWDSSGVNIYPTAPIPGRHTIMDAANLTLTNQMQDPMCSVIPKVPPGFNYVARIGNDTAGAGVDAIEYTLTVDSTNSLLVVHFAYVLGYNSSLSPSEQPRFSMTIRDTNGNPIPGLPCGHINFTASQSLPNLVCQTGSLVAQNWTTVGYSLNPLIGQTIKIYFETRDCPLSLNSGYAYVVAECRSMSIDLQYCEGMTAATFRAPEGFSWYAWRRSSQPGVIQKQGAGRINQSITVTDAWDEEVFTCELTSALGSACSATINTKVVRTSINAIFQYGVKNANGHVNFHLHNWQNWYDTCARTATFVDFSYVHNNKKQSIRWRADGLNDFISEDSMYTYTFPDPDTPTTYLIRLEVTSENGCFDTSRLRADHYITIYPSPRIEIVGNTLMCQGDNNGLKAVARRSVFVNYQWTDELGNILGTGDSITVNSPGRYYLMATADTTGCVVRDTIVITPLIPNMNTILTPVSCYGSATGGIQHGPITGGQAPYSQMMWFYLNLDGTVDILDTYGSQLGKTYSNLVAGTYFLEAIDATGCLLVDTIKILQPDSLILHSTSTPVSFGLNNGEISLTAIGGVPPYNFRIVKEDGMIEVSNTNVATNLAAGDYMLEVTDANNCVAVITNFNVARDYIAADISGTISVSDTSMVLQGMVFLYSADTANIGRYSSIDSAVIQAGGTYHFTHRLKGDYLLKAVASNIPNAVETYFGNTDNWALATVVTISDTFALQNKDIEIIVLDSLTGSAQISGFVGEEGDGTKSIHKSEVENPCVGVAVLLKRADNLTTVSRTQTNVEGFFAFKNVPIGRYIVVIDIPGLGMTNFHEIDITEEGQTVENQNYTVTEDGIKTEEETSIVETQGIASSIQVYPNPAQSTLYIISSEAVEQVSVYDISGKTVGAYSIRPNPNPSIDISGLANGIYLVKVKTAAGETVKKIVKQ